MPGSQNSIVVSRTRDLYGFDPREDPEYWNNYWLILYLLSLFISPLTRTRLKKQF